MNYRVRVIKVCEDGTEFSIETYVDEDRTESLSRALEKSFGSLRSFNAEVEKQEEKEEGTFAVCPYCKKDIDGTTVSVEAFDNGWWLHQECFDEMKKNNKQPQTLRY